MSGPEIAVMAVGVLAVAALLGVAAALVQVRRLRAELAAAPRAVRPPAPVPARQPPRRPPAPVQALPARDPDPVVAVASNQQLVLAVAAPTLIRVAALTHGVRSALRPENRDRIAALVRRDLRRREKLRRRAARRAARVLPLDTARNDRRDLAS